MASKNMLNRLASFVLALVMASLFDVPSIRLRITLADGAGGTAQDDNLRNEEEFQHLVREAQRNPSSLNQERLEDLKDFDRLSPLVKLIKPSCRSHLADALPLPQVPVVVTLPPGLKPLWIEALDQPEVELQLQAIEAINQAHGLAQADFRDVVPRLVQLLAADSTNRLVKLAAARCLVTMNAREAAPTLRAHAADGLEFAQVIEPALAQWDDRPIQTVWLARLAGSDGSSGEFVLAIQGAARTQLMEAVPRLRTQLFNPRTAPHVRLEAARSLGYLADAGNTADAQRLAAAPGAAALERVLAAHLLVRQNGSEAVALLQQLAVDPEPAAAAAAFRRMLEIDPQLCRSALVHAVDRRDSTIRQLAAETLFLLRTPSDIPRLGGLLGDTHPIVRSHARRRLVQLDASPELSASVRDAVMQTLQSDAPRGIAQGAIAAGELKHRPAADRLVDLLNHDARDVSLAVAWAFTRLAAPVTAEPIFEHLQSQTRMSQVEVPIEPSSDLSWTWDMYEVHKHLIEALGVLRYRGAELLLREYIPFPPSPPAGHKFYWIHSTHRSELRARAIWSLGEIHAGNAPDELTRLLVERADDPGEVPHVAAAAALALGRMKAQKSEETLRRLFPPGARYSESAPQQSVLAQGGRIALELLTGEPLPALEVDPYVIYRTGWFLEPLAAGEAR